MSTRHAASLPGWDLEDLARAVASLRYDALGEFLDALAGALYADASADSGRGRVKLANLLCEAGGFLDKASARVGCAWDLCEPFIHEDGSC